MRDGTGGAGGERRSRESHWGMRRISQGRAGTGQVSPPELLLALAGNENVVGAAGSAHPPASPLPSPTALSPLRAKAFPGFGLVAFVSSELEAFHPLGVPREERGWHRPRSRGQRGSCCSSLLSPLLALGSAGTGELRRGAAWAWLGSGTRSLHRGCPRAVLLCHKGSVAQEPTVAAPLAWGDKVPRVWDMQTPEGPGVEEGGSKGYQRSGICSSPPIPYRACAGSLWLLSPSAAARAQTPWT